MQKQIEILKTRVEDEFLPFVRRPGRYIGGEINQITKDLTSCKIRVALCFPDVYEIAMSNSAIAVLYNILNQFEDIAAERVYSVWEDAEQVLREKNLPLFTLESKAAVKDFDILGFSLNNELCYTNVLNVLDLAKIPLATEDRTDAHPIVIAGGQSANCAEPIADFIDIFILGEGEEIIVKLTELISKMKTESSTRTEILTQAAKQFDCLYVPSLYEFEYEDNKIKSLTAKHDGLPLRMENAIVKDFDSAKVPENPLVPFIQTVHERVSVEIMRGCPGRCRFCQASFCRRPIRFRSVDTIFDIAKTQYESTGFDTVSLLSLSSGDYPDIEELLVKLQQYFEPKKVGVSFPSLRVKETLKLLPKMATSVRKSGLTIAVEAASEKLRNVINKPLTNTDLFAGIEAAYAAGFQRVKLYFMVGFPGETEADIEGIVDLAFEISNLRRKVDSRAAQVNAAISWLVPKPHTPLGWFGQKQRDYFHHAKDLILQRKRNFNGKSVRFNFHNTEASVLEAAIGRGDRRLCKVVKTAWQNGARFDLWDECFDFEIWQKAFAAHNLDIDNIAQQGFDENETLPWQHLGGPEKIHILQHYKDAMQTAAE